MKKVLVGLGLLAASLVLNSCTWQTYTKITTTHFRLSDESVRLVKGKWTEQPISISVRYEDTDENGEVSYVMLADGPLEDGELELSQSVSEPTEVVISVKVGEDGESSETTAVLKPGTEIEFVLVHRMSPRADYYYLQIKGKDHRSTNQKRKFSTSGDLSKWVELGDAEIGVLKDGSALKASGYSVNWSPSKFLIDNEGCIVHKHIDYDELEEMLSPLSVGSS